MAVVAAPGVEQSAGVGHAAYTLWVFAIPLLASALVEAPIAVWSDGLPRRRVVACALGALALSLGLCALPGPIGLLSLGLALAGAASGVACGTAQAELVATHRGGASRAMSRWIAFCAAGDLLCPLVVAAALQLGGSYRAALGAIACVSAAHALALYVRARAAAAQAAENRPAGALSPTAVPDAALAGAGAADDAPAMPLREALRHAARQPRLWALLLAAACCCLLDELVVALAALRLHGELGWSAAQVAAVMTAMSAAGLAGAVLTERALGRWQARTVLGVSALATLASLALFALAASAPLAALALALLGLSAAPHYPLLKAAAYELLPGRPGLVNALSQPLVAVEVAAPVVVGVIAARHGLTAALAALAAQPLIALLVARFALRDAGATASRRSPPAVRSP